MSDCFCMNSMIWLYCNLMSYVCRAFDSQMEYKCTDFNGGGGGGLIGMKRLGISPLILLYVAVNIIKFGLNQGS